MTVENASRTPVGDVRKNLPSLAICLLVSEICD
jgi:hypothetical protein